MSELLDELDFNGKVIGQIEREHAHNTGAWHKAIHVYAINDKKQLLMQLRSKDKDIGPSLWDISVGGHVSAGESTVISAQRETEEEIGIKANIDDFKYLFTTKEILKNGKFISCEFVDIFLLNKNISEKDIHMQKEEVANFKFINISEFIYKIKQKDKDFLFHYDEYVKMILVLQKYI